jgi:hypothetical protein
LQQFGVSFALIVLVLLLAMQLAVHEDTANQALCTPFAFEDKVCIVEYMQSA